MKSYLGDLWVDNAKNTKVCNEYYDFTRNFALVDFPKH